MNGRLNRDYQIQKISQTRDRHLSAPYRRPFWLPALNYYILAAAATLAFFFLVWGVLHEGEEEMPLMVAGIGASLVLGSAVVAREIFLRQARNRYLTAKKKLDYNVKNIAPKAQSNNETNKLSLEKNAAIVKEIQKKSEAARILGSHSSGHLEVFEICQEYLSVVGKQLELAGIGSPRLVGLRRGREIVGELHRYHLLAWAEIESRALSQKAHNCVTISKKLNTAQAALSVLDSALRFYPNDSRLTESETALKDFIASIKVSHWVEQAERSAFKGNFKRAISFYRDALFFLDREDVKTVEREKIAEKINSEIEKLQAGSAQQKKIISPKKVNSKQANE